MSELPSYQMQQSAGATKPKASYSEEDDCVLLAVLTEQKAAGFQTDNGGFHQDAFKAAASKMPDPGPTGVVKTAESIKSHYNILKKDFKDVKEIREKSGFGWDEARSVATATAEVWDALIAKKPSFKKWKKKAFPLYDMMEELLENQVASGDTAFFPGSQSRQPPNDHMDFPGSPSHQPHTGFFPGSQSHQPPNNHHDDSEHTTDSETHDDVAQTIARTPTRRPSSHDSSTDSVASIIRKRRAASPESSGHPAKRVHGQKPTQSDAGYEMADAMRDLARSAMGDITNPSTLSPDRKRCAIERLEADDELSDNEMTDAFKLIRRQTSIADTYLAIGSVACRTLFIQAELNTESF